MGEKPQPRDYAEWNVCPEPPGYQIMGVWIHEALQVHPNLKPLSREDRPSVVWYEDRVEIRDLRNGGTGIAFEIRQRHWWGPLNERHARQIAHELVTGLREAIRAARRAAKG